MTLQELEDAYSKAQASAASERDWYASRRRAYITLSWVTRILAAVFLCLGIILPLLATTNPIKFGEVTLFSSPAQAAIACIALAALIIGSNQVFMITGTWVRYINAMTKIETLCKVTALDWDAMKSGVGDPVPSEFAKEAFALFKALVVGSRQIVEAETTAWGSEIVKAMDELKSLISQQRTVTEAIVKEQQATREASQKQAAASNQGAVRVKIEGDVRRLSGPITIAVDDRSEDRPNPLETVVLTEIPVGPRRVRLVAKDANEQPVMVENIVQVVPSGIADVPLSVPAG